VERAALRCGEVARPGQAIGRGPASVDEPAADVGERGLQVRIGEGRARVLLELR
jgi:hypothetical protein